ncbi:MAG: transcriptional regulator NrdR [Nanoarchaeota archaeon]
MKCPYCNCKDTKVIDSRETKEQSSIKRRRECINCLKRFSTIERVLKLDLEVKKSNGNIEVFNLQKIKKSLLKACEKRPITLENIEDLISAILQDIKKINTQVIPTSQVGSIVLKNLKDLDEMAFLKYAIVHNNYETIKDFTQEIEKLKNYPGIDYANVNKE